MYSGYDLLAPSGCPDWHSIDGEPTVPVEVSIPEGSWLCAAVPSISYTYELGAFRDVPQAGLDEFYTISGKQSSTLHLQRNDLTCVSVYGSPDTYNGYTLFGEYSFVSGISYLKGVYYDRGACIRASCAQ